MHEIADAFRLQAEFCRSLSAPFTARAIDAAGDDIEAIGPLHELVKDWAGDQVAGALALRVAAAVHATARANPGSALGALYARKDAAADRASFRKLIANAAAENGARFSDFIARPVQTNEVRRAAALLGGFLHIAKKTGLPLDLFEIGASGGLLLGWDRYAYDFESFRWGGGEFVIQAEWRGQPPDWPANVAVGRRLGCDLAPVNFDDPAAVERASCYFWVEHVDRRERWLAAIEACRGSGVLIEPADAGSWLRARLSERVPERTAVVLQSVMAMYLTVESRRAIDDAIEGAALLASIERPLARLAFEPFAIDASRFAVDLTLWPGGQTRRLAYAHPHGAWVEPLEAT